jgi:hypothetical protein
VGSGPLGDARPAIFDGFSVLSGDQRRTLVSLGCDVASIGRGELDQDVGDIDRPGPRGTPR